MRIHQLLMGRDVATNLDDPMHSMAASMANFAYVVETQPGQAILVDAAWDVEGVMQLCAERGLEIQCAVFTHRHLDHTGAR